MRVTIFLFSTIYKNRVMCVGADDGQTLVSGFIDSTPVNTPLLIEI